MKKINFKNIFCAFATVVQLILFIGVFILQYLTNKSAGVMHHVYYKRYQFENTIFSNSNLKIKSYFVIFISALFLLLLVYSFLKNKNLNLKLKIILGFILSVVLYIIMMSGLFSSLLAFHYFIFSFAAIVFIQLIVVLINFFKNS